MAEHAGVNRLVEEIRKGCRTPFGGKLFSLKGSNCLLEFPAGKERAAFKRASHDLASFLPSACGGQPVAVVPALGRFAGGKRSVEISVRRIAPVFL